MDNDEASPFAEEMTMREQVMDIIESILADTEPRSEGARNKLRELVEARPHDPEVALLEHLLETRKLTSEQVRQDTTGQRLLLT